MKIKIFLPALLLAGGAVIVLLNARANETDENAQTSSSMRSKNASQSSGEVTKASDVLGREVKNSQNEKLGKVDELAIDLKSGRIPFAVVSSGKIMGMAGKDVVVLPQFLRRMDADKTLQLEGTAEKWQAAPVFDLSKWDDESQSNRVFEAYHYYGERPYFAGDYRGKNFEASAAPLGHLWRASKTIGTTIRNDRDEKVGTVQDLAINLHEGRVVKVIVASGGFLGMGDEYSALSPEEFHFDQEHNSLQIHATKDELAQAPHFKSSEWPDFSSAKSGNGARWAHPDAPMLAASTANGGSKESSLTKTNGLDPMDQSNAPADVEITRRIRQRLVAQQNLSMNARNVKIITINGAVTLRGAVNSDDERRMVGEIASQVAPADRLDNQLEVKNASD